MSISQLLSSDAPQPRPSFYEREKTTYEAAKSEPSVVPQVSDTPAFRNGIKNLLNNDSEEMYQMADSDTDTEDIPLMPSSATTVTPTQVRSLLYLLKTTHSLYTVSSRYQNQLV